MHRYKTGTLVVDGSLHAFEKSLFTLNVPERDTILRVPLLS